MTAAGSHDLPPQEARERLIALLCDGRGGTLLQRSAEAARPLGVSDAQAAILGLDAVASGSGATTIGVAYDFDGAVDPDRLQASLAVLAGRMEVLRAGIDLDPVRQVVAAGIPVPFTCLDGRGSLSACEEKAVRERTDSILGAAFDTAAPPLWRALLTRRDGGDRLVLQAHHAIADGASLELLARAIEETHARPHAEQASVPLAIARGQSDDAGLAHFRCRLEGGARHLDWPFGRPALARAPRAAVGPCARGILPLGPALEEALGDLARRSGTTPFVVCLTAFATELCRLLDVGDVVIGLPVAVRDDESAIGCFVDMIPLRFEDRDTASFAEAVAGVAACLGQDLAHRRTGWSRIVADFRARGEAAPAVDVIFGQGVAPPDLRLGAARGSARVLARSASSFALVVELVPTPEGLVLQADRRTDIMTADEADAFLGRVRDALSAAVADPMARTGSVADPGDVAPAWSGADVPAFPALASCLGRPGTAAGTAALVVARGASPGGEALSGPAMVSRIDAIAADLRRAGIRQGDRVAVLAERSIHLPIALAAVLQRGAAYLPLDRALPVARMTGMLLCAGVRAILATDGTAALAEDLAATLPSPPPVIRLDEWGAGEGGREAAALSGPASPDPASDERAAYVIFTSGSSGKPKGVEVSRRSLAHLLDAIRRRTGFGAADRLLGATAPTFDIATLELLLPLAAGAELIVADEATARDPWQLSAAIEAFRPTVLQSTPSLLQLLVDAGWRGDPRIDLWCGGEALPQELAMALKPRCRRLFNFYGPTETTIWSTAALLDADTPVHVGEPLARTRLHVLDRHRRPRSRGLVGEVAIGGAGVAIGYVGASPADDGRFAADPVDRARGRVFVTGDRGFIDLDGQLHLLGRVDDQVKLHGHRVELGEVDAALRALSGVDAAACAICGTGGQARLVAGVVGPSADPEAMRAELARTLPPALLPSRIVPLARLPLTAHGKIDRRALSDSIAATPDSPDPVEDDEGPGDEIVAALQALFNRHCGRPAGPRDDFLSLGGDSIAAVRLLADVRRQFGAAPAVAEFLRGGRTPLALAAALAEAGGRDMQGDLEALLARAEVRTAAARSPTPGLGAQPS